MELHGKLSLVSGASSGIRAATARQPAVHGVRVGVPSRRQDRPGQVMDETRAAGSEARAIPMDLTDPATIAAATKQLADASGAIDIAFNNAGLMSISISSAGAGETITPIEDVLRGL